MINSLFLIALKKQGWGRKLLYKALREGRRGQGRRVGGASRCRRSPSSGQAPASGPWGLPHAPPRAGSSADTQDSEPTKRPGLLTALTPSSLSGSWPAVTGRRLRSSCLGPCELLLPARPQGKRRPPETFGAQMRPLPCAPERVSHGDEGLPRVCMGRGSIPGPPL